MPFRIDVGDPGAILARLNPVPDPGLYEAEALKLRQAKQQAQQEQALYPMRKRAAELELAGAEFNQQERELGVRERDAGMQIMQKHGGDYTKARPELATVLRPATLMALDKMQTEHSNALADVSKKQAEAAKIMQGLQGEEDDIFGSAAIDVQDAKYSPVTFDAILDKTLERYPQYKEHIGNLRQRVIAEPDALRTVVDAMVTPNARKAWQELRSKKAQQEADEATAALNKAKAPGEIADAEVKRAEADARKAMTDADWQSLIDKTIEDHNSPLYRRTLEEMRFYRTKGDLKSAADVVKRAGEQLGRTETAVATAKATVPFKVEVAGAAAGARAEALADASGLTEDDYNRAGEQYMRTGVMPAVGRDSVTRGKIVKAGNAWARDNGFSVQDVVTMQAAYAGDKESLKKFQAQRDAIVSFEQTAQKNLDLFISQAAKIVDSGVPWINKPLRMLGAGLGSTDLAAVNAARQIANNEIAKVTSGGGLGGVLSDSARHEVQSFNPNEATLAQTVAVAKILKQDMANRHQAMDASLSDIKSRIGGGGHEQAPPAGGRVIEVGGKYYRYNGSGAKSDLKNYTEIRNVR